MDTGARVVVRIEGRTAVETSIEEIETTVGHTEDEAVTASTTEKAVSQGRSYVGNRGLGQRRANPARRRTRTAVIGSQPR